VLYPNSLNGHEFRRSSVTSTQRFALLTVLSLGISSVLPASPAKPQNTDLTEAIQLITHCEELNKAGQFDQAIPLCERALAITRKYFGPTHEASLRTLNDLGVLYLAKYDYSHAEEVLQQGLSIAEASGNVQYTASILNNLSSVYQNEGNYRAADPLLTRSLKVTEQVYGSQSLQFGIALDNAALLLHRKEGDDRNAELLAAQAVAILLKVQREQGNDYAGALNHLGSIYDDKGDFAHSLPLHKKAISIREQLFGQSDASLVIPLNDLAAAYNEQMNFQQAEDLYRRSLSISEATEGPNAPEVATTLGNLGLLYIETAKYKDAEPVLKRSLQIRLRNSGEENPDVARALNNLGILYQSERDYERAETFYQRALAIWEKVLGPSHPDLAAVLSNLAFLNWANGNKHKAALLLQRGNEVYETNLRLILASGSEEGKRLYLGKLLAVTDFGISFYSDLIESEPEAADQAALLVLQRKGRVIDSTANEIGNLRRHLGPNERKLFDKLVDVRARLAGLAMQASGSSNSEYYLQQYQRERAEEESVEEEISSRSAVFKAETSPLSLTAVQRSLPPGSALVEYVSYFALNPAEINTKSQAGEQRYAAYVLNGSGQPVWKNLGPAQQIDSLIARYRTSLTAPSSTDVDAISLQLYDVLVRPFATEIQGKRQLFVAPDGALNLIPFSTLKDSAGRKLIEKTTLTFLTAGRDLLRQEHGASPRMPPLVVASPDYDMQISFDASGSKLPESSAAMHFAPLHGTLREADAIHDLLPAFEISTGKSATKEMLERVRAPLVLHVATHGFFLESNPDQLRLFKSQDQGQTLLATRDITDPLVRSGLAFAGANRSENGRSPGILTALEASNLDLWGTQLVVLSACDTGLGTVRNGDGVYGLRRAMVMAGARCQVMSLWKVDDYATKDLMTSLYKEVLGGASVADALRTAQTEMTQDSQRQHPYYWASFIASGDCGQLDLKQTVAAEKPVSGADLRAQAASFQQQGKLPEAEAVFEQALEIDEARSQPNDVDVNKDRHALAEVYYEESKFKDAERMLEESLTSEERTLGLIHPDLLTDLNSLGLLYANQGEVQKAEALLKRALDIEEQTVPADHPDLAQALHNLGGLFYQEHKYDEAEPLLQRAIAIEEKAPGAKQPDIVSDLNYLAAVYSHEQKYAEAESVLKKAMTLQEKAKGPNDQVLGTIIGNLAFVLRKQGREAEAKVYEQRADKILGKARQ
jgi:CHAT domain-containing protein/Tfp pilus assembly protein PilF